MSMDAPIVDAGLLDELFEGYQVIAPDFTYLYVNAAAAAQGRTTPSSLVGRTMMDCYPGIEATAMFTVLRRSMVERIALSMENEFLYPDGSVAWFELRFAPVPKGVFILSVDVTSRKRTEAALVRSREEYRALVENLDDVVYALDERGTFTYVSPALEARFGFTPDDVRGHPFTTLVHAEDLHVAEEGISSAHAGGHHTENLRLVDKQGRTRHVRCSCRFVQPADGAGSVVGVLCDMTEQRSTEDQLRAAQRMESIGRLAGGVAHDFNNLLSVILSYTSFALQAMRVDDPMRKDIEEVVRAGKRAASLTRQLLAFSRRQVLQPEVLNLNQVIEGLADMLHRLLGEDVKLRIVPCHDLGHVKVDPMQIEQVLMNLAVNARDAMPGGGMLTISTFNVELDEQYARQHASIQPGPYVGISVADTGCGMNEATKARIFEPFFTTKEAGKGTGLGLSTVFGIVKQSSGSIWVYSEVGRGTTFKVYFPREFSALERSTPRVVSAPAPSPGDETVLVVEDEEAVRHAATRILEAAGYHVLTAENGEAALHVAEHCTRPIHVLITDVVMPGMSGADLARRMLERNPDLRVVYMSGYTDDNIAHHGVLERGVLLVEKPFGAVELTHKVRKALDQRSTPALR